MKKDKRKAPPVTTGYDPRAVERAPKFADGHLPEDESIPLRNASAAKPPLCKGRCHGEAVTEGLSSEPTAPDGISGDWQ